MCSVVESRVVERSQTEDAVASALIQVPESLYTFHSAVANNNHLESHLFQIYLPSSLTTLFFHFFPNLIWSMQICGWFLRPISLVLCCPCLLGRMGGEYIMMNCRFGRMSSSPALLRCCQGPQTSGDRSTWEVGHGSSLVGLHCTSERWAEAVDWKHLCAHGYWATTASGESYVSSGEFGSSSNSARDVLWIDTSSSWGSHVASTAWGPWRGWHPRRNSSRWNGYGKDCRNDLLSACKPGDTILGGGSSNVLTSMVPRTQPIYQARCH